MFNNSFYAQVAQLVEQATENRCVGGSIPPLGTFVIFLISILLSSCEKKNDFYPDKQGMTWNYQISLSSDYTESTDHMRMTVTNISTVYGGKGVTFSKLYSNGDLLTFFKDKNNNQFSRIAAFYSRNNGLNEPVIKVINPSLNFEASKWKNNNQLFFTKGFQPPLRGFIPSATFEMDFEIVSKEVMIKVKAGIFKNCIYVKGKGHTEFIADTRSRPNKVNVSSEEWICPNVGIVKQNRTESTNSSAFGTQKYLKELISVTH